MSVHRPLVHIEALIPVWIQRLLDDACRPRLLATNRRNREGIRESCSPASATVLASIFSPAAARLTEDISLVQAICRNDCFHKLAHVSFRLFLSPLARVTPLNPCSYLPFS